MFLFSFDILSNRKEEEMCQEKKEESTLKSFGMCVLLPAFLAVVTSLADGLYCHYFFGVNVEVFGMSYFQNSKPVAENNEESSIDASNSENVVVTTDNDTEDSLSQADSKLDENKGSCFKIITKIVLAIILFFPLMILNLIALGVVASVVGEFGAGLMY